MANHLSVHFRILPLQRIEPEISPKKSIKKVEFQEMVDHPKMELYVVCTDCDKKFHQICVLYLEPIWPVGFTCDDCLKKKGQNRRQNQFSAKRLPDLELGKSIQRRVNNFLTEKAADADEVVVPVVACTNKVVKVQRGMRREFVEGGDMVDEFPFKAKAIFAFQRIEDTDVCFFGMHVHEFDNQCGQLNARRIYISYRDSVHFFTPSTYRKDTHQEILLGYLDYAKKLGFTMAHIWASPPVQGDNYIFNCHPTNQRIVSNEDLDKWYTHLLEKGKKAKIVVNYQVPTQPIFYISLEKNRKEKKTVKRRKSNNSNKPCTDNALWEMVIERMKICKKSFFVVRLHEAQTDDSLSSIQDPDPVRNNNLMDGRAGFLMMSKKRNYEFSSLRRAKFSSMAMLYELHNRKQDKGVIVCANCRRPIDTKYHSTVCDDIAICMSCKERDRNPNPMKEAKQTNPEVAEKLSEQFSMQSFNHACQCSEANCQLSKDEEHTCTYGNL